jgi:3-hydroxyisobutyrate dehydrogenase-like beta-hydroxyacid dehydrogenase
MTVAFVGLGRMGAAMAGRLLESGHTLRVYNRTAARADELVRRGAHLCVSPAEAARGADAAVTMVADDRALLEVSLGDEGLAEALPPQAVHLSMSTVSPEANRAIAEAHRAAGSFLVAAPVMGRPEVAAAGRLWILGAGPAAAEERARALLASMSRGVSWLGEDPGLANVAKVSFNFLLFSIVEAVGEALTLVEKHGGDRAAFFEATNQALGSAMIEGYGRRMLEERFLPAGFTSVLALKDVALALHLAETGPCPLPVGSLLRDHLLAALARGRGDWDTAALVQVARENAGLA